MQQLLHVPISVLLLEVFNNRSGSLPVQVTALSETSIYQSAHYSHTARGKHIVITGHLTVPTAALLVDELYSTQDFGFPDFNLVFLCPDPPCDQMKRLLKIHKQSHRLLYVQGSCMDHKVGMHALDLPTWLLNVH